MKRSLAAGISLAFCLISLGCTNYYRVTDPSTGKQYYTKEVKNRDGATMLIDQKTNQKITIQNSEVMEISADEFKAAVKSK